MVLLMLLFSFHEGYRLRVICASYGIVTLRTEQLEE
jgi:hypothetical protein